MPDPLDDALDDLRISGSVLLHETYAGSWAIAVPDEAELRRLMGAGPDARVLPFHLVRRGGVDLIDADGKLRLDEPELSLVPGGQPHQLAADRRAVPVPLADILAGTARVAGSTGQDDTTELVCGAFVVRAAPLNPLLGALPAKLKVAAGGDAATPALSGVAALLAAELGRQTRNSFTAQRLLEVLCAEVIRAFQAASAEGEPSWLRGLQDPKIADSLRRVHAAPGEDWTVEALADAAALSPSRFAARFRQTTGESVMGYVARWRANVACRLLRESDLSVAEVAARVGYESLPAFSRAFKAQVGAPPAEWRQAGRASRAG